MIRLYELIIDGGADNLFKVLCLGYGEYDLKERYKRVGKIVRSVDVTDDYPISVDEVRDALLNGGFGKAEADFIRNLVAEFYPNARLTAKQPTSKP